MNVSFLTVCASVSSLEFCLLGNFATCSVLMFYRHVVQKNTLFDLKCIYKKITIESYENAVRKSSLYNKEILKCNKKDQISSMHKKLVLVFLSLQNHSSLSP